MKIPVVLLSLCLALTMTSCESPRNYVSRILNADFSDGEVLQFEDTHGGLHGDGHCYAEIRLDKEQTEVAIEEIKDNDKWRKFPMTDNFRAVVEMSVYSIESLSHIHTVKNGYYYFSDNQLKGEARKDDSKVLNRSSYNFTIAVFDVKTQTLYYYTYNT